MTVVVAGYEIEPEKSLLHLRSTFSDLLGEGEEPPPPTPEEIEQDELRILNEQLANPRKAFVLADSLLSREHRSGRIRVAETAEKVSEVPISIKVPDFDPAGFPNGNAYVRTTLSCGVAYAGNAQMWQLTMDRFRQEMRELRYTWIVSTRYGQRGSYAICRQGAPEDISTVQVERIAYGDSIDFASQELPGVEADFLAEVLGHCFNEALMDYFPKEAEFQEKNTVDVRIDIVLLAFCQKDKVPRIYRFGWEDDRSVWPSGFKSTCVRVPPGELVVLGQESWRPSFENARLSAISSRAPIEPKVRAQLAASMKAHASQNYVGGKIRIGRLESMGFKLSN